VSFPALSSLVQNEYFYNLVYKVNSVAVLYLVSSLFVNNLMSSANKKQYITPTAKATGITENRNKDDR